MIIMIIMIVILINGLLYMHWSNVVLLHFQWKLHFKQYYLQACHWLSCPDCLIHLAVQTVYTTMFTILEHLHWEFRWQLFLPKFRFLDMEHFKILTWARLPYTFAAFPPLGNSDHVVISVSIDFPTNSIELN